MSVPRATGPSERARYTAGPAIGLRDGTLLADRSTSTPQYYIWSNGTLHEFKNGSFAGLGYQAAAAITAVSGACDKASPLP